MVGRRRALVAVLVAVLTVTGGAPALATDDAPVGDEPGTEPLVEAADCTAPAAPPPALAAAEQPPGATAVTFRVPSTTRVRVDAGQVVAASTNSGCAPRSADLFVVADRAATSAEVSETLDGFQTGDWTTPGTWHLAD